MVVVVNEVLVPLVDHVDKPLECLEAVVFVPKLLDNLSAGVAIGLGNDWWEVLQHADSTLCIADASDRPVLFHFTYRCFTLR